MTNLELLTYAFLNERYLAGKRNDLAITSKDSPFRSELEREVGELEERFEREKQIKADRSRLLAELAYKGIKKSQYDQGFVIKSAGRWKKLTAEQALEIFSKLA